MSQSGTTDLSSANVTISGPVTVTGTVTADQGTTPWIVDGSGVTQPVSAVSLPLPTGASTEAKQDVGNTSLASIDAKLTNPIPVTGPLTDTQLRATPVPVSGTVAVTGTVSATQGTTPWLVDGSAHTQPISGTVTIGAGSAVIGHVITDTGSTTTVTQATGTNLHTVVDSGTITAVTSITNPVTVIQPTGTNLHTVIDSGTLTSVTTLGTITNALPTGANNIGSITNITGTITLPTLASTSTKQSDGSQKTQIVDGSGNVIASTSNALNVDVTQPLPAGTNIIGKILNSPIDGMTATYSAAFTGIVVANTATDIFTLTGSGTKTVKIIRIVLSGYQNTANTIDILLIKRSTANSGGTSTSGVSVPHDSTNAAATATTLAYTVNPSLGATVGTMRSRKIALLAKNSSTATDPTVYEFGDGPEQAIVLRGTGEVLAINLNGQTLSNNSLSAVFEWTEA